MAFQATEKQLKAAKKEGGKKGQDLSGLFDMGGISFFHVALEKAEGETVLVDAAMEGANREVDEDADDRKGGAGHLGKCFLSANDKQLVIKIHVPGVVAEKMSLKDWLERLNTVAEGEVVEETDEFATIVSKADAEAGKFPLKLRDTVINAGFALLRERTLVPEDSDSDSDYDQEAAMEEAGIEW